MRTFLSSIFSFRTLAASDVRGSGAWQALVCTLCLVGAAELVARSAIAPIGDYWEYWSPQAAAKFEKYRSDVSHGTAPEILVVGDSTGARDLDPAALADTAAAASAFNLAWPANFPLAFAESTSPLLRAAVVPKLVVVSFSPTAFLGTARVTRFEDSILSSAYCQRLQGKRQATDLSYLARLRPALPFFRSWWTGEKLPQPARAGFMPLTGMDMAPDAEEEAHSFGDDRFAVLTALLADANQRNFQLLVILPPRLEPSKVRRDAEQAYVARLDASGIRYLDFREAPFLSRSDFYDRGHLNRDGARILSEHLGMALRQNGRQG
jgi:hypothetical protein